MRPEEPPDCPPQPRTVGVPVTSMIDVVVTVVVAHDASSPTPR